MSVHSRRRCSLGFRFVCASWIKWFWLHGGMWYWIIINPLRIRRSTNVRVVPLGLESSLISDAQSNISKQMTTFRPRICPALIVFKNPTACVVPRSETGSLNHSLFFSLAQTKFEIPSTRCYLFLDVIKAEFYSLWLLTWCPVSSCFQEKSRRMWSVWLLCLHP